MRFISCYCCYCCAGKVDISRQGQIFTRRCKETTALLSWRCELLWQFSCELWKNEGFDVSPNEGQVAFVQEDERKPVLVFGEKWFPIITNWFNEELSPDDNLPSHISGENKKKYSCDFFLSPLKTPYASIWESTFPVSPFTLTFDKFLAIWLHFREKSGTVPPHSYFDKSPPSSIYELIS